MDLYKELKLTPVRAEPNVWISRLVIFEKVAPERVYIRDTPLHRGLNIVWAEEPEEDDPSAEISGHSAGKTTFCRFIRHVLGEKTFGTRANMELIRKAVPGGYVAAEIHVAGKKWAVRRPIGSGRMSYIKEDTTVEELLDQQAGGVSHDDYTKKLGLETLLENLETATIVRTDETIQWGHVLAWCARDQEARFQSIHEWRSPRSQSDSPGFQRPKEGPLFVMRAILGLFLPDELKGEEQLAELQKERDRLEKQIEEKRREPEFWANRHDKELRRHLTRALPNEVGIDTLPLHTDELFPDLSRLTDQVISDFVIRIQGDETQLAKLQEQIDDLSGQIHQHENTLKELGVLFNIGDAASKELDKGLSTRQQQRQQLQEHQDVKCPFGGVLIRECSYVLQRQATLSVTALQDAHAMEQAEAKRSEERTSIEAQKTELTTTIEQLANQRKELQTSRDSLEKALRTRRGELNDLRDTRQGLETWTQSRDHGVDYPEIVSLREQLETTNGDMETLEGELTKLLQQHDDNRELLASIFSCAVRATLPSGTYDGQVSLEDRELAFRITHGSAMSGEAIETLSVLLSDIAAQVYSTVSAGANLPGFLLHDSPREADLGPRIYRSFIRAVAGLQSHFSSLDACPFQFVLTTTTPPPPELRGNDFVKLPLNAGLRSGLLLRRSFAEPAVVGDSSRLFGDSEESL